MRDDGKQRAGRAARRTLALLPIPDGLDRHAKPRHEFLLGPARAAAQVAHLRDSALQCHGIGMIHRMILRMVFGRERNLLPVPQFDDPSIGFEPEALHVRSSRQGSSSKPVKAQLTIKTLWPKTKFSRNHNVA